MRCDNNQNYNDQLHNHNHYHYHYLSGSATFSNNASGFQQTAPNLHPQGGSPIGLSLRKSSSLINLVEMRLSEERQQKKSPPPPPPTPPEKLKASNFPAALLQIGSWKRCSRNEGDLVAKLYYAKKKLVWEFLDGPLKSKIEIQWSEISGIRAFIYKGEHGLLEIELNQPPKYGREINPQPRKHTQWKQTTDFTQGQASFCRRHSVIFPPGVLDKHYEKLLQCDIRLFNLSQQPFSVNNYPFSYHDPNPTYLDNSTNLHNGLFLGDSDSNLPSSVMRFPYLGEEAVRYTNENQEAGNSEFEEMSAIPIGVQNNFLSYYGQESWTSVQQSQTKMLLEGNDSIRFVTDENSSIDLLQINSRTNIQEPNSSIGVSSQCEIPWDTNLDDLGDLYGNQHNNLNWT